MATLVNLEAARDAANETSLADQISNVIKRELVHWTNMQNDNKAAKAVYDGVVTRGFGPRTKIMLACAAYAAEHDLTPDDIDDGVKAGVTAFCKDRSVKPSTLGTFGTEVRRVMHPNVCEIAEELAGIAHEAWQNEQDNEADETKPLKSWYKREYHLFVGNATGLCGEAIQGRKHSVRTIVKHAVKLIEDKPSDPDVAKKSIDAIVRSLSAIYAEFPCASFDAMLKFSKKLTVDALKAEHAKKLAADKLRAAKRAAAEEDAEDEDEDEADKADAIIASIPRKPYAAPTAAQVDEAADDSILAVD
jgi:hypothetical protein